MAGCSWRGVLMSSGLTALVARLVRICSVDCRVGVGVRLGAGSSDRPGALVARSLSANSEFCVGNVVSFVMRSVGPALLAFRATFPLKGAERRLAMATATKAARGVGSGRLERRVSSSCSLTGRVEQRESRCALRRVAIGASALAVFLGVSACPALAATATSSASPALRAQARELYAPVRTYERSTTRAQRSRSRSAAGRVGNATNACQRPYQKAPVPGPCT